MKLSPILNIFLLCCIVIFCVRHAPHFSVIEEVFAYAFYGFLLFLGIIATVNHKPKQDEDDE